MANNPQTTANLYIQLYLFRFRVFLGKLTFRYWWNRTWFWRLKTGESLKIMWWRIRCRALRWHQPYPDEPEKCRVCHAKLRPKRDMQ